MRMNLVLILTDDGEQRLRQFSRCLPIREKGAPFRKSIVRVRHSIFVLSAKYPKKVAFQFQFRNVNHLFPPIFFISVCSFRFQIVRISFFFQFR